jgi:hypothetical protein
MIIGVIAATFCYSAIGISMGLSSIEAFLIGLIPGGFVGGVAGLELSSAGPSDRHSLVITKSEAPRLRGVQIASLSVLIVGSGTCTLFAGSDSAVTGGLSLFGLGVAGLLGSQVYLWLRRLLQATRSRRSRPV